MAFFKLLVFVLLDNQISGHILESSLDKRAENNPVYLNVTVYQTEDNYTLTYDILPVQNTTFHQGEPLVEALQDIVGETLMNLSTEAPETFSIQALLSAIPTIPNTAAQFVGNIFGDIRGLIGANVTQFRRRPLGSAFQTVSNFAFCNALFARFNPGRCKDFLKEQML